MTWTLTKQRKDGTTKAYRYDYAVAQAIVPAGVIRKLKAIARAEGVPVSQIVRRYVLRGLAAEPTRTPAPPRRGGEATA